MLEAWSQPRWSSYTTQSASATHRGFFLFFESQLTRFHWSPSFPSTCIEVGRGRGPRADLIMEWADQVSAEVTPRRSLFWLARYLQNATLFLILCHLCRRDLLEAVPYSLTWDLPSLQSWWRRGFFTLLTLCFQPQEALCMFMCAWSWYLFGGKWGYICFCKECWMY